MKRLICGILTIALVAGLAACSGQDAGAKLAVLQEPVYPKGVAFDGYEARKAVEESNPVESSFVDSVRQFSYRTTSKLLSGKEGNATYSPISLFYALALAGVGANGVTRNEIFATLCMEGKDSAYLSAQAGNLFRRLNVDNDIGKLHIANSLWLQKGISFKEGFTKDAVGDLYASLHPVDFADSGTGKAMGKWVSDHTNGVLAPEITTDAEQILSILNTVYFKDEWLEGFPEESTAKDAFHLEDGSEVTCDFMNRDFISYPYIKGEGFTGVAVPLKNRGDMLLVLPDKDVSVDSLLATPEKTEALFADIDPNDDKRAQVIFKIPKFSFGNEYDLADMLKGLGMKAAFELDAADFTGITDEPAFISEVKQGTHVAIDEKGVEAAAFTQIGLCGGGAIQRETIVEMILDRPFIFGIRARDGTLLFAGVCRNPTLK